MNKCYLIDRYTGEVHPLPEQEFQKCLEHSGSDVKETEIATSINGEEEIMIKFKS